MSDHEESGSEPRAAMDGGPTGAADQDGATSGPGSEEEVAIDLDGLVSLSFNPLKLALGRLLARMDRQDKAIRELAVAEPGRE